MGNTPNFPYLDSKSKKSCEGKNGLKGEREEIEEKCKPESEENKTKRHAKRGGLLGKLQRKPNAGSSKPNAGWIGSHCDFLMLKPGAADDMVKDLEALPAQMAESLGMKALEAVEQKVVQALEDAVKKKLAKLALKQGFIRVFSFLGGPVVGVAVNVAMTADAINDVKRAVEEFPQMKKEVENAQRALESAKKQVTDVNKALDHYRDPKTGLLKKDAIASDMMELAARTNDCLTARRCMLVPYNQTGSGPAMAGKGCCPGQTGHHLLPEAMFDHCSNYGSKEHARAPTMCVEGATNSLGSHGKAHRSLLRVLDTNHRGTAFGQTMTKADAIDAGVESVRKTFPESKCSEECLKAQLENYYKKINCKPKKESGIKDNKVGAGNTSGDDF
ncbi:HNH/endonuclease VII fold toxin-2 domain-containing protein [Roseateles chitinivorans]|uniref:HNH/endonuclease VII fold toxin-2 domain-containing protein n=1 Tax=Roseateles chitinivorans TaxID=2917965 RepID=UPI003D66E800